MRISDWSSDVCSSDLPIRAPFRLLTARCRHILFTQPAESSLRSNDDRIVHRPEELVLYTFELRRDLDLAAELLGALVMGETKRDRRSEEHTSELQSLMRISYAVFCLKKKIQTSKDKIPE